MSDVSSLEREVLIEKINSPHWQVDRHGAVMLLADESVSDGEEEDHVRIQCIYPGLQLEDAYKRRRSR